MYKTLRCHLLSYLYSRDKLLRSSTAVMVTNSSSSSSRHKSKKHKHQKKSSHKSEKSHKKSKKSKKRRHRSCSSDDSMDSESTSVVDIAPRKNKRISASLNDRFTELAVLGKDAKKITAKMSTKTDVFHNTDPAEIVKAITRSIQNKDLMSHMPREEIISSTSDDSVVV